jgi:hypothetical protein
MKPDCDPAIPAVVPPLICKVKIRPRSAPQKKSKVQPGIPPRLARDQPPERSVEQARVGDAGGREGEKRVSKVDGKPQAATGVISGDVVRLGVPMVCRKNEE